MKFWWWKANSTYENYGDSLTPRFLDYFGIKYSFSDVDFEAISIGSIAKVAKPGTIVLGSGVIHSRDEVCPTARWLFVRGPLTRKKIIDSGGECPEIYGDPAMMLPLICDESKKQVDVGLVPHFSQYEYVKENYPDYFIIDLRTNDPIETTKEITSCRRIISSSLHGIICAHAYGIPAAWVDFCKGIKGDGIKFNDHFKSLGIEGVISTVENPIFSLGNLDISNIVNIFKALKS